MSLGLRNEAAAFKGALLKKHFLTFGSQDWEPAVQRITQEAYATGEFDHVHPRGEGDLTDWPHKTIDNTRGYKLWLWKPYLALRELHQMDEGDILCYADAGCSLTASERWAHYFQTCQTFGGGFFVTQYPEEMYTKKDTIARYSNGVTGCQLWAGAWFVEKNDRNIKLLEEWADAALDIHLVDDSPSVLPNAASFVAHRHDQSVISLLVNNQYPIASFLDHDTENFGTGRALQCTRKR